VLLASNNALDDVIVGSAQGGESIGIPVPEIGKPRSALVFTAEAGNWLRS
jgi:hypothetical protein